MQTATMLACPLVPAVAHFSTAPEARPGCGSECILVVDDEPDIRDMLEIILGDLGYSVVLASNGQQALELLGEGVQLVILDMLMPVMDGLATLQAIRLRAPEMKMLVASGYTSPEKMAMVTRIGVEGFVQKPFQISKLTSTVREVLDGAGGGCSNGRDRATGKRP